MTHLSWYLENNLSPKHFLVKCLIFIFPTKIYKNELISYKLPPVWVLSLIAPYLNIDAELNKTIWEQLTHAELRQVFKLKNSTQINKQITSLKEKVKKNELLVLFASFVMLAMKGKSSEAITRYLKIIEIENKKLGLDSMRDVLLEINYEHLIEVRQGISILTNQELIKHAPTNFEMMALNFINDFSDIGCNLRLFNKFEKIKYKSFNDLAKKIMRRVEYQTDLNLEIPKCLPWLNGVKFSQYEIITLNNTKELSWWALSLENCLNGYKECAIKNEKVFIALAVESKIKWVAELSRRGDILEIKGKYNIPAPEGLKEELLTVILAHYPS